MLVPFGTHVRDRNGKSVGTVSRLVLHPDSRQVVAIVVQQGVINRREVVVPLDRVAKFGWSSTVRDGGDQIAVVLTVLLLPVALLDSRRWHWVTADDCAGAFTPLRRLTAWSSLGAIRLQLAGVYFVAGISKLGQAEWANGTALYYWMPYFGAPDWVIRVLTLPVPVVVATWVSIAIEIALALGIILPARTRVPLLAVGIVFHILIAAAFGLWSFSMAMVASLVLYLHAADEPLSLRWIASHRLNTLFIQANSGKSMAAKQSLSHGGGADERS